MSQSPCYFARYTAAMNRRTARYLFAVASRLLLSLALVFATGPWAAVLASTAAADCLHAMAHATGNGDDCCADAHGNHGMPDCGQHGATCGGVCAALCAVSYSIPLPAAMALMHRPANMATLLPRVAARVPSLFAAPALRPPISV